MSSARVVFDSQTVLSDISHLQQDVGITSELVTYIVNQINPKISDPSVVSRAFTGCGKGIQDSAGKNYWIATLFDDNTNYTTNSCVLVDLDTNQVIRSSKILPDIVQVNGTNYKPLLVVGIAGVYNGDLYLVSYLVEEYADEKTRKILPSLDAGMAIWRVNGWENTHTNADHWQTTESYATLVKAIMVGDQYGATGPPAGAENPYGYGSAGYAATIINDKLYAYNVQFVNPFNNILEFDLTLNKPKRKSILYANFAGGTKMGGSFLMAFNKSLQHSDKIIITSISGTFNSTFVNILTPDELFDTLDYSTRAVEIPIPTYEVFDVGDSRLLDVNHDTGDNINTFNEFSAVDGTLLTQRSTARNASIIGPLLKSDNAPYFFPDGRTNTIKVAGATILKNNGVYTLYVIYTGGSVFKGAIA